MKNLLLSALFLSLALGSCQKEKFQESESDALCHIFTKEELDDITRNFCRTIDPEDSETELGNGAEDRATASKGKIWPMSSTLRVRFLSGSTSLTNKVMTVAKQWENYADITFTKVTSGTSDIRIRFDANDGHWSYVGTDNGGISQNDKTMNLALSSSSSDDEIRRVVLHEFGHALGLMHEHQNPFANIPWNKQKVYDYYKLTQGWSAAKVDEQVLNKLTFLSAFHTDFDSKSIMEYPVPASLTTNGYSIPWNTNLSEGDKNFIGKMYSPKRIRMVHNANISGSVSFYVNGIYYTIAKNESLKVPANTSNNTVSVWECPNGNNSCRWSDYQLDRGDYKIISASNNPNDLKIAPQ